MWNTNWSKEKIIHGVISVLCSQMYIDPAVPIPTHVSHSFYVRFPLHASLSSIMHVAARGQLAGWCQCCVVTGSRIRDVCLRRIRPFRHRRLSRVKTVNADWFDGVWLVRERLSVCLRRADGPQSVGEWFADVSVANRAAKYGRKSSYQHPSHIFYIVIADWIYNSATSNDLFLLSHYLRQICSVNVCNLCYFFIIDTYMRLSVAVSMTWVSRESATGAQQVHAACLTFSVLTCSRWWTGCPARSSAGWRRWSCWEETGCGSSSCEEEEEKNI